MPKAKSKPVPIGRPRSEAAVSHAAIMDVRSRPEVASHGPRRKIDVWGMRLLGAAQPEKLTSSYVFSPPRVPLPFFTSGLFVAMTKVTGQSTVGLESLV